jgi:hypothetical protein
MLFVKKRLKILDFDIESRPLSFWVPTKPTAEITAIASCWVDEPASLKVDPLGVTDTETMLLNFVERYDQADMVTGHYIRGFDLPMINGALMEFGLPHLKPKMVCDTRMDMRRKGDIPATQEYLGEILGVSLDKVHMTQNDWREGNRLLEKGIEKTRKRVVGDVYQHILIRGKMLELNLLKSPRIWSP